MRPLAPSLIALCLCLAGPAVAGSAQKAAERRMEAEQAVQQILAGGSVQAAVARIQYLGEQEYAADQLVASLRRLTVPQQRRDVVYGLSMLATADVEPALLRLLRDDDPVVRMNALQALARTRSRAVGAMQPLLRDPSMPVRREAAKALGEARTPATGKLLMAAAQTEGEPEVRAALLVAVGQSGDKRQVKPLERFLQSSSESTRFAAARGLCGLGAESGFAFARKLLASEDRYERRQGLELFEGFPAKSTAPVLRPLLKDPDKGVAARAARILYQGGETKMLEWLVLEASTAKGDEKLAIERELETFHLADDERRAILVRASGR